MPVDHAERGCKRNEKKYINIKRVAFSVRGFGRCKPPRAQARRVVEHKDPDDGQMHGRLGDLEGVVRLVQRKAS